MPKLPVCDYHMHTPLCGHATGQPEEYAAHAETVGLAEIGFSDHAPLVAYHNPAYTMYEDQLPLYHQMMKEVKQAHPRLSIKVGIEADYLPGFEDKTRRILEAYPYDYVIGSVHFIDNWAFDDPELHVRWKDKDIDRVYRDYYELLRRSARSGLFDIIGHADLVKKFGHRPTRDLTDEVKRTAEEFAASGVTVEINSSGLRKPVKEIYPSLEVLKVYRQAGVPITFSSDAHAPEDVGRDFDLSADLARAAGYRDYRLFRSRRVERTEGL